jgi:hypothetical protein
MTIRIHANQGLFRRYSLPVARLLLRTKRFFALVLSEARPDAFPPEMR